MLGALVDCGRGPGRASGSLEKSMGVPRGLPMRLSSPPAARWATLGLVLRRRALLVLSMAKLASMPLVLLWIPLNPFSSLVIER
eukprot:scaffold173671_cov46-Prasinocladus_malaysianus.AAC.1